MTSLRIVHAVRSDSFAGVERYVTDVATELTQQGHHVTVIGGDPALCRAALPVEVRHLPAASTAHVAAALSRCGRQDVVHVHMSAAELAAVATRSLHRAPVVATRHFAARRGGSAVSRAITRTVAKGLSQEISISQFVARESGPGSVVLHNGVRIRPEGLQRERTVVVMQRLEREKDTATAIRAFARSGLAFAGWRLRLAGRGSQRPEIERLCRDLGVEADLLGFVSEPATLLARAGILLAPAPAEPFGLTVVEAMASGTPVIASSGGAHPETLGTTSSMFPAGDVAACSAGLRVLAEDDTARASYGTSLRRRQQQLFGLETHVAALGAVYGALT